MNLDQHPTVARIRAVQSNSEHSARRVLEADWLRGLALECGADDAGLVEIGRTALDPQRDEIRSLYPWTRTLLSFVIRMTREPVRSPARSVANLEFHHAGDRVNEVGHDIVRRLEQDGLRAVNPSMAFPMEMGRFPDSPVWVVSHKPIAVEAGLGHMGIHRNLIHPKFGNFVLLGTVLIEAEADAYDRPIDYNPCLECKLCVAACPVGAISPNGRFDFSACFTHNYREFMGGFSDWIEQVADSKNALDYRTRISGPETASMWQSLSYGPNYKSAYCMAVCPAGEDVIGPYLANRTGHVQDILRPLQDKEEPVYVIQGSDAEAFARKRWKHKTVKPVGNGLNPRTIEGLFKTMPFAFQPNQSRGLSATYQFTFTGEETLKATVEIRDRTLRMRNGHSGKADLQVIADSRTWIRFLAREQSLFRALARRKIRIKGSPGLLIAFGKCFPGAGIRHAPVEIRPLLSKMRPRAMSFRGNDAATGKIKWSGRLLVTEIIEEVPNVKTFRLSDPGGGTVPFHYLPGQFLTLDLEPYGIPARRAYTIASTPTRPEHIEITVKREENGLVSNWLHDELKAGDELKTRAPNGTFLFTGHEAQSIVLIGGGVGVTPLMSIARYLSDRRWSGEIHMLLSFRKPSGFLFKNEITALKSLNPNLHVWVTMTDPAEENWTGPRGRIDRAVLHPIVARSGDPVFHVCGPASMMNGVHTALIELGVTNARVKMESFGNPKQNSAARNLESAPVTGHILFQRSDITAPVRKGLTILDVAEEANIPIDNACRSGTCGLCRVKLLSGNVRMTVEDALTESDKLENYVLACQAEVEADAAVDA